MRILFLGDIFARSGRDAVAKYLPKLKNHFKPDFTIINGENAAHGFGITPDMTKDLFKIGVDVITGGNHTFDKAEIIATLSQNGNVLRPLNLPENVPGKGYGVYSAANGQQILVINLMGRLFMEPFLNCPFKATEEVLKKYPLGGNIKAIFVDIHGETTSEKMAFAKYFDGKISAVVGTHTHIPTADAHIMKGGTAYQTDAGMCGDYDSVIGLKPEIALANFLKITPRPKNKEPASGPATVCGVFITTNAEGKAEVIEPVRLGPVLQNTHEL